MNTTGKTVAIVVGAIVLLGGSFYTGTRYAQENNTTGGMGRNGGNMIGRGGAGLQRGTMGGAMGRGGNLAGGEVIAKDDTSITVKMGDTGSKIIFFTKDTPITKNVTGSASDITLHEQITATGKVNSDGSITAQSIQIRPATPPTK